MSPFKTPWFPIVLCLALLAPGVAALAEDEAREGEVTEGAPAGTSPLKPAEDKAAKALASELKKIAKKKNSDDVLPVLEKIDGLEHKAFDKPLCRLLRHESSIVSLRAADMWEWRVRDKRVGSRLWRASWGEKKNDRRYAVKAKVLKAYARAGLPLDAKQFKEVDRAWRWMVGNPDERWAPALSEIAAWVALSKDMRLFRKLAEELDEPLATNPNSPSNPPASWWEKRWKMWKAAKPAVVEALKALTGQEFDKTAEAKAWVEANGKKAGIEW